MLSDSMQMAVIHGDIGVTYYFQSRYEKALDRFEEALRISRETELQDEVAANLNNVGLIHRIQGRDKEALVHYRKSLAVERDLGNQRGVASSLNNIGSAYLSRDRYEKALEYYREALSIHRKLGYRNGISDVLNNIGIVRREQGKYEEALRRYRQSLAIKREQDDQRGITYTLNNIGNAHRDQGRFGKALRQYHQALRLNREIGRRQGVAYSLGHIGGVYLDQGRLPAAIDTLEKAVRLGEELRLNATSPEARRSLLSAQIESYQGLTNAYVRSGQSNAALRSVEQARARLLADQLAEAVGSDTAFAVPSAPALRRTLDANEAALLYANPGTRRSLTALVATRDTVYARMLPDSTVRAGVKRAHATELRRMRRKKGPLTAATNGGDALPRREAPSLLETIRLYRHYLTREGRQDSRRQDLARRLYDLLIEPVKPTLQTKKTLTVVPTGALGYLPFGTLRAGGRHFVERKQIRYAQSLAVLGQLQERTYTASRKPLLALGGAAYEAPAPERDRPLLAAARGDSTIRSAERASRLFRSAKRRLDRGRSPHPTYADLGYDQWSVLYGTKLEVQKLNRAVAPGVTILTGSAASEERIRQMSASGRLADYRHLHFATHGIAVPEAPQLSALVLSQAQASDSLAERDGYLTMREISELEIRSDVAVLSACRTGLGRIVAGEGVVNLSHAFLRAGANATLVSQWRVLDWSTQQFMTAVYRKAQTSGTSFVEAVTQVKRDFISGKFGERNTNPMRWAPFVYYGRE